MTKGTKISRYVHFRSQMT